VNPFFTQKTGYTQAEVLGRNPRLLQSGHTHPDVYQELWRTLTAQRVWRGELSNRSKTGALFIERVVIAPVVGASGRVSHYVALKEDVTDEQHAQQARLAQSRRIEELSRRLVHAQEEARSRFARELHDRTSPNLAVLRINLDILAHALQRPPRPGEPSLADRIDDTRAVIEDTNASIREICAGLHPAAIERGGLLVAVRDHAQQWARRTGIAVQVQGPDDATRLPPDLELALFRVVQEALANCAKHAQAHTVHIAMQWAQRPITLSIADDGRGFDPATTTGAPGLGLVTMRETAEFVGGQLTITSTPGHGTRISVEIADVNTSESLQKQ
jgi:PAS domain S-box-containing protein